MVKMGPRGWRMVRAYENQKYAVARRGIAWEFDFASWCDWWMVDDRVARRGRGRDKLCMARHGDVGPYSYDNCYPATLLENAGAHVPSSTRVRAGLRAAATMKANGVPSHLTDRQRHPCAKRVQCPAGVFASAILAAEASGIAPDAARRLARYGEVAGTEEGYDGWRYLPAEPTAPKAAPQPKPRRMVITPHGTFDCLMDAAMFYGCTPQRIGQRCRAAHAGWRYR